MSVPTVLDEYKGPLTRAESQLVAVLRENVTQGAFFSATELARRAKVHPSTVVRFAQKLGYKGFFELRDGLRQGVLSSAEAIERVERRLAHLDKSHILFSHVEGEIESLRRIQTDQFESLLDAAAQRILAARQVFLFSQVSALALVEILDRRFRRIGIRTILLGNQGREIAERLLAMNNRDVLLGLAFTSSDTVPPAIEPLLVHAQAQQATSIVISDHIGPFLDPRPGILLSASRGEHDQFKTLTVPMALCNALALMLAHLKGDKTVESRDRVNELARVFDENGGERKISALNGDEVPAEPPPLDSEPPVSPPATSGRKGKARV